MMTHYIYVHDVPSRVHVHVAELLAGAATAPAAAAASAVLRFMYLFFYYYRIILGTCRTRP